MNGYTIAIGTGAQFYFDGTAWLKIEAPLHNDLAGRSIASAHPTSAIATDTTNFDGASSVTETTTQLALRPYGRLLIFGRLGYYSCLSSVVIW